MDASARRIMGLISEMNARYVVPVYQRPYSWGDEQCVQLWDDILSCGRRRVPHFTGSIVTIQDGTVSDQGVAQHLVIDGQQRITTIMLLLMALARYASRHPEERLSFSRDEIVEGGYLTNRYRSGEDHYKLTLSKNDRAYYQALVDHVERPDEVAEPEEVFYSYAYPCLRSNLALFEQRLEALDDVDSVWAGLQRLEVVSVSLTQGVDDPQVIFESMNSTGKDLSSGDLVRNFVLMGYPLSEQQELYRTYWRPLEEVLGSVPYAYDDAFDEFARCYLGIVGAPEPFEAPEVYPAFKRHVLFNGYATQDRMKVFALRLRRFAGYFATATRCEVEGDEELTRVLRHVGWLEVPGVTPLVMELLDAYDRKDVSRDDLIALLTAFESYLFRRAVCDCEGSALAAFLPSLVARVSAAREAEGNVAEVFLASLLNEEGTSRRFPTNEEFAHALASRDMFSFAGVRCLLARLEGAGDLGQEEDLMGHNWTVEHVMPVGAPKVTAWRSVLGDDPERTYEAHVGSLGNIMMTKEAYDLQECTFEEKRERARAAGGPAITADVAARDSWDMACVEERTQRLVGEALEAWRMPALDDEVREIYRAHGRAATKESVSFADLFKAGLVEMDDVLVSANLMYAGRATVTSTGKIMLANGEMFDDPTAAYERFLGSVGAAAGGLNGWLYWRRGEGGPTLDELRLRM